MFARRNLVKTTLLGLGLSTLTLAPMAQAQTAPFRLAFVGGGSSALQGNYPSSGNVSFGALPFFVGETGIAITNFRTASATVNFIRADVTVTVGGAGSGTTENATALIAYTFGSSTPEGSGTDIVIFVRSDSGQGVRYVANGEVIKSFSGFQHVAYSGGALSTPTTSDNLVTSNLTGRGNVPILSGFADVTADSVASFAGIATLNTAGLSGLNEQALAIQTLLLVHNSTFGASGATGAPAQVNFTRDVFRSLIAGAPGGIQGSGDTSSTGTGPLTVGEVTGQTTAAGPPAVLDNTPVRIAFREPASGTRITELLDIQLGLTEYSILNPPVPNIPNPNLGTGALLTAVSTNNNSAGYAFVTGGAGNNLPNIRVATYNGVAPYVGTSLPNNNGQAAYGNSLYYTNTANGRYTLWSQANLFTAPNATTQQVTATSLVGLLTNTANAGRLHTLGFAQVGAPRVVNLPSGEQITVPSLLDMQVVRTGFLSGITGEFVTDGQFITYDTSSNPFYSSAGTAVSNAGLGIIE